MSTNETGSGANREAAPTGAHGDVGAAPGSAFLEGEEPPPAGVRVMAAVRWILVVAVGLVAAASALTHLGYRVTGPGGAVDEDTRVYYCPMHPQVVQDHPGECPICSMTLVPRPKGPALPAQAMAPGSAAQLAIVDAGAAALSVGAKGEVIYACPMHPQVTSKDPKARCRLCGMPLEPPEEAPAVAPKVEAVPGLVPLELGPDRVQLIGMKTAQVTRQSLSATLRAAAVLAANERGYHQVTARFSGFIEQLRVSETGQAVKRGQVLATIFSPEALRAQQELLSARAWAAPARKAGAPHGGTEHQGLLAGLEGDARRRLELLGLGAEELAEIERTGKPLAALPLRAPTDGHVIGRTAAAGAAVQAGAALFEIADLGTIWALADVYESDIARVRIGQDATLTLPAYPGEVWKARVTFVYPTLDPGTRTLRARLELRNRTGPAGPRLRPGMFGHVTLALPEASTLVVPGEAVVDTGELQYVFVAKAGGRYEPRRVKPGASVADRTEILEGLGEGETVVTTANFLLDSESRLQAAITGQASAPAPREGSPETTAGTATEAPAASKPTGKAPMPLGHRH